MSALAVKKRLMGYATGCGSAQVAVCALDPASMPTLKLDTGCDCSLFIASSWPTGLKPRWMPWRVKCGCQKAARKPEFTLPGIPLSCFATNSNQYSSGLPGYAGTWHTLLCLGSKHIKQFKVNNALSTLSVLHLPWYHHSLSVTGLLIHSLSCLTFSLCCIGTALRVENVALSSQALAKHQNSLQSHTEMSVHRVRSMVRHDQVTSYLERDNLSISFFQLPPQLGNEVYVGADALGLCRR